MNISKLILKIVIASQLWGIQALHAFGDQLPVGLTALPDEILNESDGQPTRPFLDDLVGDAKVVALGESIHTSGGFHKVKSILIKDLIQRKGFRLFALETPRLFAEPVRKYLSQCDHSPNIAIRSMFSVMASQEMLELLDWICRFNTEHQTDKVEFIAFDMQEARSQHLQLSDFLKSYLPESGLPEFDETQKSFDQCKDDLINPKVSVQGLGNQAYNQCKETIFRVSELLNSKKMELENKSKSNFLSLSLAISGMQAYVDQMFFHGQNQVQDSFAVRDKEMAHAFLSQRELLGSNIKTIIWAHNYHIEKSGTTDVSYGISGPTFGEHLHAALKNDYVAIALMASNTHINWPAKPTIPRCRENSPPQNLNSIEAMLAVFNFSTIMVDLELMSRSSEPLFSSDEKYNFDMNGGYSKIYSQFDGILYLKESLGMNSPLYGHCNEGSDGFLPEESSSDFREYLKKTFQNLTFQQCEVGEKLRSWASFGDKFDSQCLQKEDSISSNSVRIASTSSTVSSNEFGGISQCISVAGFNARFILEANLRSQSTDVGIGFMFASVFDEQGQNLFYNNSAASPISGVIDWSVVQLPVQIPKGAASLCIGTLLMGAGDISVKNIEIK